MFEELVEKDELGSKGTTRKVPGRSPGQQSWGFARSEAERVKGGHGGDVPQESGQDLFWD